MDLHVLNKCMFVCIIIVFDSFISQWSCFTDIVCAVWCRNYLFSIVNIPSFKTVDIAFFLPKPAFSSLAFKNEMLAINWALIITALGTLIKSFSFPEKHLITSLWTEFQLTTAFWMNNGILIRLCLNSQNKKICQSQH